MVKGQVFEIRTSMNRAHFFLDFLIYELYNNMLFLTDENVKYCCNVLLFDTNAVKEHHKWTAMISYDFLPYNFLP